MSRQERIALVKVGCYILLPLAFWLIPTARIEAGPSFCLFRRIAGVSCPGCGMTRALSCAAHGHPRRALAYNSRVVIALPLLLWAWARGLFREWRAFRATRVKPNSAEMLPHVEAGRSMNAPANYAACQAHSP